MESVAGLAHEPCSCCQMMILERGDVIVCHSQLVLGLDQEVVVDTAMLKVMNGSCYVGSHHHEVINHLLAQQAAMVHNHVDHVDYTGHMQAAVQACIR